MSATKPNRLMMFKETVAVYSENHKEREREKKGGSSERHYI
jgi:hypothetical protein